MGRSRFVLIVALLIALAALPVLAVQAAPLQDPLPDGTIKSVTPITDAGGAVTGFEVVITDSGGTDHTVTLTPEEAVAAGLVTDNGDGTFTVNDVIGQQISGGALFDACGEEEGANPVSGALTAFFCQSPAAVIAPGMTIEALHQAGYGYGLIAQGCFMAEALGSTCGDVLAAKTSHDYSTLGIEGVKNWGQLRKYVTEQVLAGKLQNLGSIMSGRATPTTLAPTTITTTTTTTTQTHGHGNHGNGHNKEHGHGHDNGHGNGHRP